MTRLRLISAVLTAVLALSVLSACGSDSGSGSGAAVTVNGVELSDAEFRDELNLLRDHPEFSEGVYGSATSQEETTIDAAFAAEVLRLRILIMMVEQEFDSRELEVTDDDLAAVREDFHPDLVRYLGEMPDDYADDFVLWNAKLIVLGEDATSGGPEIEPVTDEEIQQAYDENRLFFTEVCATHVLVETEDEALEILDELEAGGDLGEIATERSIDPSAETNAGALGCAPAGNYVGPFAEAVSTGEIGEYLGPIETNFGFHVILVSNREVSEFDDVVDDIRTQLETSRAPDANAAFGELLDRLVNDAEVEVNPRYGTWDPATRTVTLPSESTTTQPGTDPDDLGIETIEPPEDGIDE